MTETPRRDDFDPETSRAFSEMLVMHQLSLLPERSLLPILQSIPRALLETALAVSRGAAWRSPCRDGWDSHANSRPRGSR